MAEKQSAGVTKNDKLITISRSTNRLNVLLVGEKVAIASCWKLPFVINRVEKHGIGPDVSRRIDGLLHHTFRRQVV